MKKKIFIASHCMELGGAERSLIGLLNAMDYEKYEVDLMLYRHTGELMEDIPKQVNILPVHKQMSMLAIPFKDVIKKGQWNIAWGRFLGKKRAEIFCRNHKSEKESMVALEYSHKYTVPYVKTQKKEYDLAISFLTPHYYVADKVKAKTKLAWIHTDYRNYLLDIKSELLMWEGYDYIASISSKCTEGFIQVFPELEDKIVPIENIISTEYILKRANEQVNDKIKRISDEIILCSVGRYTRAKNFDNVPDICKRIRNKGINAIWYLIGYGGEEELIRKKIKESGMEEQVILLGKKANPYPYIKACDIYVQPSRYEGKAVSVLEAQILGKPVVITNFPSAQSQIEDRVDGIIVPMDNESCANGIIELIKDKGYQDKLIKNCKNKDFSNKEEVNKLYQVMEE